MTSFQAGRAITNELVQADPGSAELQRDLSVWHDEIGDVRFAQGKLPEALASFEASVTIREKLAKADPGNTGWQRDLIVSCVKIAAADPGQAKIRFQTAYSIACRLRDDGRLAPRDGWMVEDLARRLDALPD